MIIRLADFNIQSNKQPIHVPGSKSESNRLLILKALFPSIEIENISTAVDTIKLQQALIAPFDGIIDIHHAGTAMRFLTAFFAAKDGCNIILTGSERMQERPIGILVEALKELGAQIDYTEEDGFPPLKIRGKQLMGGRVSLDPSVSSQYISALLLMAPTFQKGLDIHFKKKPTSAPYIEMSLALLKSIGVNCMFNDLNLKIESFSGALTTNKFTICSDWSSASYFYSAVALSPINTIISLSNFTPNSLQGDSQVAEIYKNFGVSTRYHNGILIIEKTNQVFPIKLELNLNQTPDLAQTIAVTCLGLGVQCYLTGLHTLKIKETDRLVALKNEIEKCNGRVEVSKDTFHLTFIDKLPSEVSINTYEDHRMAMAFAPLSMKCALIIHDAMVVQKSYPNFWQDFQRIGLKWEVF